MVWNWMNQRYNLGSLRARIFEQISWHQRNQYEKNWEKSTKRTEKPLSFPFNCATDKLHYLLKIYLASKSTHTVIPILDPSHICPWQQQLSTLKEQGDQPAFSPWAGSQSKGGLCIAVQNQTNSLFRSLCYAISKQADQLQGVSLQSEYLNPNLIFPYFPSLLSPVSSR